MVVGVMETKKEEIHPVFSTRISMALVKKMKIFCAEKGIRVQNFVSDAIRIALKK